MRDIVIVKLGGSLITDKEAVSTLRPALLARLSDEIAAAVASMSEGVIISHGSGSFGHVAARRHGLAGGVERRASIAGVSEVQAQAHELHRLVVAALRRAGVPAYSFVTSSAAVSDGGEIVELCVEPVLIALELGLVPVTLGDVVLDRSSAATICSTESVLAAIVARLPAERLRVRRVLWMGETDGIWDGEGRTIPTVDDGNWEHVVAVAEGAAGTDVTGGMRHRLESAWSLAAAGIDSHILDGRGDGVLRRALLGTESSGTTVTRHSGTAGEPS